MTNYVYIALPKSVPSRLIRRDWYLDRSSWIKSTRRFRSPFGKTHKRPWTTRRPTGCWENQLGFTNRDCNRRTSHRVWSIGNELPCHETFHFIVEKSPRNQTKYKDKQETECPKRLPLVSYGTYTKLKNTPKASLNFHSEKWLYEKLNKQVHSRYNNNQTRRFQRL